MRAICRYLVLWCCAMFALGFAACARTHVAPAAPAFSSPEAAAVYAAFPLETDAHKEPQAALIAVSSSSLASDADLRQELSLLFRVSDVLRSDSLYGGGERFHHVQGTYYLVVDVRPKVPGDSLMAVTIETCDGWPCHVEVLVRIRGEPTGYVAVERLRGWVE